MQVTQISGNYLNYASDTVASTGSIPTLSVAAVLREAPNQPTLYVNVADSAANVAGALDSLQNLVAHGDLASVKVTDSGFAAVDVTPVQMSRDVGAIGLLSGNYYLAVPISHDNVSVTGPGGHATVVQYSQDETLYTLAAGPNGSVTVTCSGGVDHLTNVDELQFGEFSSFITSPPGSTGAPTTGNIFIAAAPGTGVAPTSGNITELYSAVLAREPDAPGLTYYENILKANPNTPLTTFAQWFLQSPEYKSDPAHAYAQTTAGDSKFIIDAYNDLLHRAPESGAIPYYLNVISEVTGGATPGTADYTSALLKAHATVITYFSQSPEFLNDVRIMPGHSGDAQHWLFLV